MVEDDGDEPGPTYEHAIVPWVRFEGAMAPKVLHLVVGHFERENLVGYAAPLDGRCWLGRGGSEPGDHGAPVVFRRYRPDGPSGASRITTANISRRHLTFTPTADGGVRVECGGKRGLFHNGVPVPSCIAHAGDTLMLNEAAVFLLEARQPMPELRFYPKALRSPFGHADAHGMVGECPLAWEIREELAIAGGSPFHVLVTGESGAGKEVAARTLHGLSPQAGGPFVGRSASSFPDSLVDAELFGCAKGYPNPGEPERPGLFGEAEGGTLFLDEVGELPLSLQTRLLRVLDDDRQYNRLGESKARRSTARFIAATNRGSAALKEDVLARFKYRIDLPGLNARRSDIPLLVHELLRVRARREPRIVEQFFEPGDPLVPRIQAPLIDALVRHHYTSHVRELDWLLVISARSSPRDAFALTPAVEEQLDFVGGPGEAPGQTERIKGITREALAASLKANDGNRNAVARELGLSRFRVYSLIEKFGLKGE